jgi:hypothetical protein
VPDGVGVGAGVPLSPPPPWQLNRDIAPINRIIDQRNFLGYITD